MFNSLIKCYDRLRLLSYRGMFRVLRERDSSLSAAEAYSVDVIYLVDSYGSLYPERVP